MALITVVNEPHTTKYSVQLTDKKMVWSQRKFNAKHTALNYIKQLQDHGHVLNSTPTVNELIRGES